MKVSSQNLGVGFWMCVLSALLMSASLSGCVGYNVYPPEAGDRGFTNPNDDPFPPVMTEALRWAVVRYPPNASTEFSVAAPAGPEVPFALNLPAGVSELLADRIAKNVGFGAQPLYAGNEKLPIYHIARVWVSGDEAKVDVIRPVKGITTMGGKDATQAISIRLRGGVSPWRVTSHRVWSLNALATPALNVVSPMGTQSSGTGEPATDSTEAAPQTSETADQDRD